MARYSPHRPGPRAGGARRFFVAVAEEGAALRQVLGPGPQIGILGGHMAGDTEMIHDLDLTPMLNSLQQVTRHLEALPATLSASSWIPG
jgi:alanine racemase